MQFARVIGTVVCTHKDEKMEGRKFLVVQPVNIKLEPAGAPLVAIDAVGAGTGELVLVCAGSSARQTKTTENRPCDAVIMGIVDTIEQGGTVTFDKSREA